MATVQSEYGTIRFGTDFTGDSIPVAGTVQVPIILSGGVKVIGEINNADDGIVIQGALNGIGRLTTTDEDTLGVALATGVCFDPALMGPLVIEARVSLPAQTARSVFFGFAGVLAETQTELVVGATTTITFTATDGDNLLGFLFDSQLTSKNWHMPYKGGSATASTVSTAVDSGVLPVNGEFDILKLELYPDGSARWYINGVLEQEVEGAASTTVNLGAVCGVFATTTTVATLDVDYFNGKANRHWDRDNA